MANAESIREALNAMGEMVLEADLLTHALMDQQGTQEANLLAVYSRHVWRLKDSFEQFETLFYRDALPILEDVARATKGTL